MSLEPNQLNQPVDWMTRLTLNKATHSPGTVNLVRGRSRSLFVFKRHVGHFIE